MSDKFRRWPGVAAAVGLVAMGLAATAAAPAQATGGTAQGGNFEVGNLLNYANSDFETTTGDWSAVSNAALSDDPDHQFLHDASLLDTVAAAGTSSFELGSGSPAIQINLTPGKKYRIGAYFKAPAASGQTVQFSLSCYTSTGAPLTPSQGAVHTLADTTNWQYSEDDITIPSDCAYVLDSPEVTLAGLAAGATVNMDEAIFAPYRAALIIGAYSTSAQDWISSNGTIGPLQSNKEFPQPSDYLPSSWDSSNNVCYQIEQDLGTADSANWPACLITYKYPKGQPTTKKELEAFFKTSTGTPFPAQQMVIMTYHDEPELKTSGLTGPEFVKQFDTQAANIRNAAAAVGRTPQVFVAADSATYDYSNVSTHDSGIGCHYIPPTTSVDFYLADHYDEIANGKDMPNEKSPYDVEWKNWLACVQGMNKPIGLAEYGQNCGNGHSHDPNLATVTQAITKDDAYLEADLGVTEPTIMWEYWYANECVYTNPKTIKEWQSIETQNGGG